MTDNESQEQIETAAEAPVHEFKGIKLNPFSFGHNACWQRMGFDGFESELESLTAIVFLCTKGKELNQCRGEAKIALMRDQMDEWANVHGINGNSDAGRECAKVGYDIWKEMSVSRFTIPDKGPDTPNG